MNPPPAWRDALLLQLTVVAWGLTAILGRLISLEPAVLVVWRTGIAAATLNPDAIALMLGSFLPGM